MVGQEQDGQPWGGFFDLDQGFTGKISQVELWDTALTSSEISLIADCKQASVRPNNRLVTWDSNAWIAVKSEFEDEPLESFCTRNPIANTFFWPSKIPYIKMSTLCKINNARMPTVKSKSETRSSHDFYTKKFIALNETHPGSDKCLLTETTSKGVTMVGDPCSYLLGVWILYIGGTFNALRAFREGCGHTLRPIKWSNSTISTPTNF